MSKAYLFAVVLLAASLTGCIEEETDDKETLEPVGEDNVSSLELRIADLETKIAEYEMPKVNFMEVRGYNYISTTSEYNVSDGISAK